MVARWGFGCEPASAASVAGLHSCWISSHQPKMKPSSASSPGTNKDPNATVQYHTGIDMKSVQDLAPRTTPHGKLSNQPIVVADDLKAIIRAMGVDADAIDLPKAKKVGDLPTVED